MPFGFRLITVIAIFGVYFCIRSLILTYLIGNPYREIDREDKIFASIIAFPATLLFLLFGGILVGFLFGL